MSKNSTDKIRELTDRFVSELSVVIHEAALDAVREALQGTPAAAPARRGRPPGRRKAGARKAARGGKRVRRSTASVEALGSSIVSHVKANPGTSATAIADALGVTTKDLRLPIVKLVGDGVLRTEGQARGTKYFAGGARGGARKKTARKKVARKKTGGRKKAGRRKKTARKKA